MLSPPFIFVFEDNSIIPKSNDEFNCYAVYFKFTFEKFYDFCHDH